jgi:hypothetical protein
MAIDFPDSPTTGDTFTAGNRTWEWSGSAWEILKDAIYPIQKTIVDAKGDLIVATADDIPARLAVGTNGYVLTADSAETTGVKWAEAAGGGKVLQVVQTVYSTDTTTTSTTFVDTGLSATITPSSASSKILAVASLSMGSDEIGSQVYAQSHYNLVRGATQIYEPSAHIVYVPGAGNLVGLGVIGGFSYLDSPATTSATTYKIQFRGTTHTSATINNNDNDSSLILMEIGV